MMEEYQGVPGDGAPIDESRIKMLEETDWKGKVVLDIGGYDGFAAEIAHKGGAKRAICLDSHQYEHYGWEDKKKEGVEYVTGDFMDTWIEGDKEQILNPSPLYAQPSLRLDKIDEDYTGLCEDAPPLPDTIIFFNILYHLWSPIKALQHLRQIIKPGGEMLLCTLFRYHPGSWAYFYNEYDCNETDQSVFWGPSLECLENWLSNTGWEFEKYALSYDRVLYRCKATIEPKFRQSEY
jgi:SAM-dependent methyltransferase